MKNIILWGITMIELQPVNPPGMADVIPDACPDVDHFGGGPR